MNFNFKIITTLQLLDLHRIYKKTENGTCHIFCRIYLLIFFNLQIKIFTTLRFCDYFLLKKSVLPQPKKLSHVKFFCYILYREHRSKWIIIFELYFIFCLRRWKQKIFFKKDLLGTFCTGSTNPNECLIFEFYFILCLRAWKLEFFSKKRSTCYK
jgi:hypothetical protein